MANLTGGDAYFANTFRGAEWQAFDATQKEIAIREAESLIGRLAFLRRPPAVNLDNAAYEQAYCLLKQQEAGPSDAARAIAQGIKSRSIADASESYASAAEREKDPGWINGVFYCPAALSWLTDFLGSPIKTGRLGVRAWT